MQLFIDTADIEEIKQAQEMGVIDGVTTNPSLVAKTGRKFIDVLGDIVSIVSGPVSAEVISTDSPGMIAEAKELASIADNIVIKIPLIPEGLKAVRQLTEQGIKTNVTLIFSPLQALLAAKAGATYASPFVGRLDDIAHTGMELIDHAVKLAPAAPIMVITAFGEVETAVEAMKKGARDYICKPLIFDDVIFKLKRLLAHEDLAKQNRLMRDEIERSHECAYIVCRSETMVAIVEMIPRIAHTTSNVLICGESGTGKEILARCIHFKGPRANRACVAVNCGGLASGLVESELFGHRRGAFTGAEEDRTGYFEAANGGSLFLDEIGNLPLQSQAVLLRAIEQKAVARVGDHRLRDVDMRVIAATNRDLEQAVNAGEFREDLFFRLNVIRITIPPLRERTEDVPLLIEHFVKKYNAELGTACPGFSSEAIEAMCGQPWRGNVRELENVIERALIFSGDKQVELADLPFVPVTDASLPSGDEDLRAAVRDFERQHILRVLARQDNNKVATAAALGIGLSSLYRKLEELGVGRSSAQSPEPTHPGSS